MFKSRPVQLRLLSLAFLHSSIDSRLSIERPSPRLRLTPGPKIGLGSCGIKKVYDYDYASRLEEPIEPVTSCDQKGQEAQSAKS